MPRPVYSRVAIRIGFGRLPPAGAREGKDHGDTDAHCARYQETRPAGLSRAQIARRLHVDRGTIAKYADMEDCAEDATDDGIDAMGNPSAGTIVYAGPLEDGLTDERLSDLFGMPIEVQHTHGRWSAYAVMTPGPRPVAGD